MKPAYFNSKSQRSSRQSFSRQGFTLLQILLVMAVIALLSAFLFGAFGRSRAMAQRADCDVQIKAITMALDAFRQDNGRYPETLQNLAEKKYLTDVSLLKCPTDPRPTGSYNDYYVRRAARDSGELPILVCPLCATESGQAIQGFKGRYTKHFATRPAKLTAATSTTIERPGKNPISGRIGMELRGGDIIRTNAGGQAIIRFVDGSESELGGNSEITVLQSFISGHARAPLYTLIRQSAGDVHYRVNHGSKFDVSTPTATAGALGTAFQIREDSAGVWWLKVTQSKVMVSDSEGRVIVTPTADAVPANFSYGDTPVLVTADWSDVGEAKEVIEPGTREKKKKKTRGRSGKSNDADDD